jgi:hypothetical protein
VFWLGPMAVVDALLVACCNLTSVISLKDMCSRSSIIASRICVGGCYEGASFPRRERR